MQINFGIQFQFHKSILTESNLKGRNQKTIQLNQNDHALRFQMMCQFSLMKTELQLPEYRSHIWILQFDFATIYQSDWWLKRFQCVNSQIQKTSNTLSYERFKHVFLFCLSLSCYIFRMRHMIRLAVASSPYLNIKITVHQPATDNKIRIRV